MTADCESEKGAAETILIIDTDLGFVFWLGHALESAGYAALPAKTTAAARELIRDHKILVDILVIDPLVPDVFDFVSELRRSRPSLRVIAAVREASGTPTAEADAEALKPLHLDGVAAIPWIDVIRTLSAAAGPKAAKLPGE